MAVVVYTTPTCRYCQAAKRYLSERGIHFREVDVSRDSAAARELMRKSGHMAVPVIDVNGRLVVGFDRVKLNQALGLRG